MKKKEKKVLNKRRRGFNNRWRRKRKMWSRWCQKREAHFRIALTV